jgi:Asp/Glu/hydantoin racemase
MHKTKFLMKLRIPCRMKDRVLWCCGAVVLGCAGMADLAAQFSQIHKVPVIDGFAAAVGLASSLVK